MTTPQSNGKRINPTGNNFVSMEEFIRTRDSGKSLLSSSHVSFALSVNFCYACARGDATRLRAWSGTAMSTPRATHDATIAPHYFHDVHDAIVAILHTYNASL